MAENDVVDIAQIEAGCRRDCVLSIHGRWSGEKRRRREVETREKSEGWKIGKS